MLKALNIIKKINFLFFFFIITSFSSFSQSKTGLVYYGEIQSMGMGAPVGPDYNAILAFNNEASLYITRQDSIEGGHIREQKSFDGPSPANITVVTNEKGFQYYNDFKNNLFYSRDLGFRYVKGKTPEIDWKISKETKKIGNFTATKATATFRGRAYTAWFTPEIPLPIGPWKIQGLPGLILEAYDTNKEIYWYFKSLEFPTDKPYLLHKIKHDGQWISQEEYKSRSIKSWENAQVYGRMSAESVGLKTNKPENSSLLKSRIEGFVKD